jgi:GTP-binding protein HflX
VRQVLAEVGAEAVPVVDVLNKCDRVEPEERARLRRGHQTALLVSALDGEGQAGLLDAITARLALDTQRVTFEYDSRSAEDQRQIAALYRHARVLHHLTTNGRTAIVADVPRRLLPRLEARQGLEP